MDINFSAMNVGDKVALPSGKWGDKLRVYHQQAADYARDNPGMQFETEGNEGSMTEKGQYWIRRIK